MDLKGKRLLILGAYANEIEIITKAKEMGIVTIVTDSHTDWELAPAKQHADEAYDVSWSDFDALEKLCREKNIDGCIAGFSELRVKCLTELCRRMGFPCYTEGADLDAIVNKDKFREACIKCGIPVPGSFNVDDDIDCYPVIVRPVDSGGGRGTRICYNREEMLEAYEEARKFSERDKVAIDEYINGDELGYWYVVHNGIADLDLSVERFMRKLGEEGTLKQPVANIYPCKYLDTFIKTQDEQFKKLLSYLGIKNGYVVLQGMMKGDTLYPIEMGYRFEGSMSFHIPEKLNGSSIMELMIRYALEGTMGDDEWITAHENPHISKTVLCIVLELTKGTVTTITGVDEVKNHKNILYYSQKLDVGAECKRVADFSQLFARIYVCADSREEIMETVNMIYDTVKVLDENGNNMIIGRYDGEELK